MTELTPQLLLPAPFPHEIADTYEVSTSVMEVSENTSLLHSAENSNGFETVSNEQGKPAKCKRSRHCEICNHSFATVRNLARHMYQKHGLKDQRDTTNHCRPIVCSTCGSKSASIKEYIQHLNVQHRSNLTIQTQCFDSMYSFNAWKSEISRKSHADFVTHRGKVKNRGPYVIERFYCSRSKFPKQLQNTGFRKRNLKSQGSRKIGSTCSAFIFAKILTKTGEVVVECCLQHHGHADDIRHLQLSTELRNSVAEKLSTGVPIEKIIEDAKGEVEAGVARDFLLSRRDVHNIRRQLMNAKEGGQTHEEEEEKAQSGHLILETSASENVNPDASTVRASIYENAKFIFDFVNDNSNSAMVDYVHNSLRRIVAVLKGHGQARMHQD